MNQKKGKQERIKANWIQKTDESKNESKDRFQIKTASFGETNLRTCGLCECGRQCRRRVRRRWRCWPETRTECDIKGDRRGVRCVWGFGGSLLFFLFWWSLFVLLLPRWQTLGPTRLCDSVNSIVKAVWICLWKATGSFFKVQNYIFY